MPQLPPLTEEQAAELARALLDQAASQVKAFGWVQRRADGRLLIRNGTLFCLQTKKTLIAVTAGHVFEGYRKDKQSNDKIGCQFGDLPVTPEDRLIARDGRLDIATFRVEAHELQQIGVSPVTAWPPQVPQEDRGIFFAGFPAQQTRELGRREFSFGIYGALTVAQTVTHHQITARFDRSYMHDIRGLGLPAEGYDLSGVSGAPVFTLLEKKGVHSWALGGVVSEGAATLEMMTAVRADFIREDGSLSN
jgi:Trypsin-like peptidase domain